MMTDYDPTKGLHWATKAEERIVTAEERIVTAEYTISLLERQCKAFGEVAIRNQRFRCMGFVARRLWLFTGRLP